MWKWKPLMCFLGLSVLLVIAGSGAAVPIKLPSSEHMLTPPAHNMPHQPGLTGAATSSVSLVGDAAENRVSPSGPSDSGGPQPSPGDTPSRASVGAEFEANAPKDRLSAATNPQAAEISALSVVTLGNHQTQTPALDNETQEAADSLPASSSGLFVSQTASSDAEAAPYTTESQETISIENQPTGNIAKGSVAGTGHTEYTWHDGDRTLTVLLQSDLVVDAGASGKDAMADAPGGAIVKSANTRSPEKGLPVFKSQSGALMTLPGGILLALDPEWTQPEVNTFFASNSIKLSKVEELDYIKNGYFVETEPGFPSLNLANTLAVLEGVVLSSPNWWVEVTIK